MKRSTLVLLALLALIPLVQASAQTSPAAATPGQPVAAPLPDTAQFLAALSNAQIPAPSDLAPTPSFLAGCTSTAQCPTGQLCCNVCGTPPDNGGTCRACLTPIRGRCPLIG
jgi:hypothetical protein